MEGVNDNLSMADLLDCFDVAEEQNAEFIFIAVTVPDSEVPEVIVNARENFDRKKAFYLLNYSNDLIHNHNNKIKVVDMGVIDTGLQELFLNR